MTRERDPRRTPDVLQPPSAPIRDEVLTGIAWFAGQAVALKVASILGRIALAHWLSPSDFGVVAMSDALLAAILVLQRAGLREQVVASDRREAVASSAFWLSVTTGLAGGALVLLAVPLARE